MIAPSQINPPKPQRGGWFNNWVFTKTIHLLRNGHTESEIREAMLNHAPLVALARPGEIERQTASAARLFDPNNPLPPRNKIAYDASLAFPILKTAAGAIERLQEASAVHNATPEEIIDALFPDDSWVCCGKSKEIPDRGTTYVSHNYKKEFWLQENRLSKFEFLVPNPMREKTGQTLEGKPSPRCKQNVLERRFLVVESDILAKNEQAAVILHLAKYASLALAVDSGGKSIHGFFYCGGVDEDTAMKFFDQAVRLGADEADRTPSQFARLPGGTRANGAYQKPLYFNPDYAK
jgi:hypothetical protein